MDRPIEVTLLSTSVWLSLPVELRAKLAKLFGMRKSGTPMTDIGPKGGVVVSDGYTPQDLLAIKVSKMQELLGTDDTDFYQLFDDILGSIDSLSDGSYSAFPLPPILVANSTKIPSEIIKAGEAIPKPKRKYTKKKHG